MWLKLWLHCGRRGMLTYRTIGTKTDMPFVRFFEEVEYENRLPSMVRRLMDTDGENTLDMAAVSEVHLSKIALGKPFDRNWFCSNHQYWAKDQDFEMKMRSRASNSLVFAGWHNVELHGIQSSRRESFFV